MTPPLNSSSSRRLRHLRSGLQVVFLLVVMVFVAIYLREQWQQLRQTPVRVDALWLIPAGLGITVGLALLPLGGLLILNGADHEPSLSPAEVWRIFYLSNIAKYLPGSIWALPGRAFLYQRAGLTTGHSLRVVFWEVLLMLTGAALVGVLGLPLLTMHISPILAAIAVTGLLLWLALLCLPTQLTTLVARLPLPARFSALFEISRETRLKALSTYAAAWIVIGMGFAALVTAFEPTLSLQRWPALAGLFAVAWLVGFLVIIAPGGIGVRDVLLAAGVAAFIEAPGPALIAIAARLGWTLAEIVGLLAVTLWERQSRTGIHRLERIENIEDRST